jgi:hypothetical protein
MEKQYKNLGYYFLILLVFVALGFYYPYFSLFPEFKSVTIIIHIHAIALFLWLVILMVQPLLIRYQKYEAHKKLGKFTYFLLPVVIFSMVGVIRQGYLEGINEKMSSTQSLKAQFTNIVGIFTFLLYYSMAILNILKGNVGLHMRYMICLFLEFVPPTFGRTLGYWLNMRQIYTYSIALLLSTIILVLLIINDKKRKSDYSPYMVALTIYVTVYGSWLALGHPL